MTLAWVNRSESATPAGDPVATLTDTLFALRHTADLGAACAIAGAWALDGLGASEFRLLRVDPASGGLWSLDESGLEVPYLPDLNGPVEQALYRETPLFIEDLGTAVREAGLWLGVPAALAALPLRSGDAVHGVMLVGFGTARLMGAAERVRAETLGGAVAEVLARAELQRSAEQQRRQAESLDRRLRTVLGASRELVSVVAHEIRTPLTAIKAYAEALRDLGPDPGMRARFIDTINQECDRLGRLVNDVLDLSRLETDGRPLRLARIGLDHLVDEALTTVEPQALTRRVQIEVAVPRDLIVEVEPDLVRRLFVNLIGNAIKYGPEGGRVRVRAAAHDGAWTGHVEDEGPGIPDEDVPRLFDRFYRGNAPDGTDGHGLGLAIARGIVHAHGGRIWVRSNDPIGARFSFTMALRQVADVRARQVARQVRARHGVETLLEQTVDMIAAAMDADAVSLMLVDPEQGDLSIAAARGLEGRTPHGRRATVRSGVAGSVAATGRPLLVHNIETDPRFMRANHPQYTTKSLLCVPLVVESAVVGVFNVTSRSTGEDFDEGDLALLASLADRVGSALERACEHPESGRVIAEAGAAIRSMTRLQRDAAHGCRQRMQWARAVGRALGMPDSEVDLIGYVSSIHDLGMTHIESRVTGAAPLDEETRRQLAKHPQLSVETIRPLGYLSRVRDLILAHHERWDGAGYPRGLAGEAIPLGSRILAVVDAFASMTRGRPYRAPRSPEEALAELRREAGSQFDPRVVEAMASVVESGGRP